MRTLALGFAERADLISTRDDHARRAEGRGGHDAERGTTEGIQGHASVSDPAPGPAIKLLLRT